MSPVLLTDDFDADLDEERAARVAAFLHEGRFQAVLATSKDDLVDRLDVPRRRVRVVEGDVREA